MIKLKDLLKESPEKIQTPEGNILSINDNGAYAFGFLKWKTYFSPHKGNHADLIQGKDRKDFEYTGRLWLKHKLISFWEYPPKNKFKKIIKNLEKKAGISIWNPNWKVEILEKDTGEQIIPKGVFWYDKRYEQFKRLISVTEYQGSDRRSKEELSSKHTSSPKSKIGIEVPSGVGSRKIKYGKESPVVGKFIRTKGLGDNKLPKLMDILLEMAVEDALKLFNLKKEDLKDKELVTKRYRKLSKKFHPDFGGSEEEMQEINDAKKTLDMVTPVETIDWDSINEKYRETAKTVKDILLTGFKPNDYISYFKKIYDDNFKHEITKIYPKETMRSPSSAGFVSEFFNKGRSIVFEIRIDCYLSDVVHPEKSLGGGINKNISFPLIVGAYGFYGNKKLKVSQKNWKSTRDHDVLKIPELSFPKNKLEKFKKTSKVSKFARKDMITYLTKKLKGTWDGTWVKIPLRKEDDLKLYLERQVFMRIAGWVPIVFKGFRSVPGGAFVTFPETLETAQYFEKLYKNAIKKKSEDAIKKYIFDELTKYKNKKRK